jgi:trans-2,3-dihydro-3-hydroxyanthranilate isomerase
MPAYRYRVVDVFTETPLEGNPLAVFSDGSGIDCRTMQKIAKELNLSETVFFLPPTRRDAAAKLRIFTPSYEMDFAGHPTIGASFVILDESIVAKGTKQFAVEENVGLVPIRVEVPNDPHADRSKSSANADARPCIWLTTPTIQAQQTYDRALCAQVLGLGLDDLLAPTPQLLTAGNPTIFIPLKNKEAVDRAWLDRSGAVELRGNDHRPLCVFVFTPTAQGAYSRMFAPEHGVVEDPATGSSTGPLAAYMLQNGLTSSANFISEQGTKMGRRSLLHVEIHGKNGEKGIDVGGYVTSLVEATMML